jgi:HEAT repeat protein
MTIRPKLIIATVALLAMSASLAQTEVSDVEDPTEVLKIAALEALMSAPPERALPLVIKVLDADNTDEVKERALFVLSQINLPEAQERLLDVARSDDSELSSEAVRMIGIGGNAEALAGLADLYASGDEDKRHAVLEAYMIARDVEAVYAIAQNASDAEEFEAAVEMLGVMGATDKLRTLSKTGSYTEPLVMALAISGDSETLGAMALDSSDPETQVHAIEALGIIGNDNVGATLVDIYRGAKTDEVREAARDGLLISGYDEGVLALYKESTDVNEKRDLLQMLSIMDSDLMMEVIDAALAGGA